MKKIYISGASGFLGRHLIRRFLSEECEIWAATTKPDALIAIFPNEKVHVVNAQDFKSADWEKTDVLINCAFPRKLSDPNAAEGLAYIAELLAASVAGGVKRVINISSQSVYSQKRDAPANEESEICLASPYATAKYTFELLTDSLCGADVEHANIRMASLIGIGFNERLVNKIIDQVVKKHVIELLGGDQIFDFMDVRDAADAICILAFSEQKLDSNRFNIGSNNACTLVRIAELIQKIVFEEYSITSEIIIKQGGEWQNSSLNCNMFYNNFQWHSQFPLERSIRDIANNLILG